MMSRRWSFSFALVPFSLVPAWGQSVISVRAGLIHAAEGSVFLDGKHMDPTFGRFEQMRDGSELSTEQGRAEVILRPGVFLRLADNSAIRMVSSQLQNPRVELLKGSAIVAAGNTSGKSSVTVTLDGCEVSMRESGQYRIDSSPARLKVSEGKAEVSRTGAAVIVEIGYVLPFAAVLVPEKLGSEPSDALDHWNVARANSVSQSSADTAKAQDLDAAIQAWENDPDALIRALGASAYIPPLIYSSPSYAPLSSYGTRPYSYPLITPGLSSPSLSMWGVGALSPFFVYPRPTFGPYPFQYAPYTGIGSMLGARHGQMGTGAYTHAPTAIRPATPLHSAPGRIGPGHIGGHR